MSLKINFKNSINENKIKNYILFSDENFQIRGLKRLSISKDAVKINKTITNNKLKDKDFLIFNLNPTQKILLVKVKDTNSSIENEKLGGKLYNHLKNNSLNHSTILKDNIFDLNKKNRFF